MATKVLSRAVTWYTVYFDLDSVIVKDGKKVIQTTSYLTFSMTADEEIIIRNVKRV